MLAGVLATVAVIQNYWYPPSEQPSDSFQWVFDTQQGWSAQPLRWREDRILILLKTPSRSPIEHRIAEDLASAGGGAGSQLLWDALKRLGGEPQGFSPLDVMTPAQKLRLHEIDRQVTPLAALHDGDIGAVRMSRRTLQRIRGREKWYSSRGDPRESRLRQSEYNFVMSIFPQTPHGRTVGSEMADMVHFEEDRQADQRFYDSEVRTLTPTELASWKKALGRRLDAPLYVDPRHPQEMRK